MRSFSSSVISKCASFLFFYCICGSILTSLDKSGKKFAPKAPARRAPPPAAPTPSAPRRPSIVRQTPPPQSDKPAADVTTVPPEPPASAPVAEPPVPAAVSTESAVSEPVSQKKNAPRTQSPTAIPIPIPKRKASVSAPVAKAPESATTLPPQPTPQASNIVTTEPTTIPSIADASHNKIEQDGPNTQPSQVEERSDVPAASDIPPTSRRPSGATTEVRPVKRPRTAAQRTITVERSQSTPAEIITAPSTQPATLEAEEINGASDETVPNATTTKQRKATKPRKRKAVAEGATGAPRVRRQRARKEREPTPEGSEFIEIAPAVVKMSELCKDLRTGKMSKRETELRNMEMAELERKQRAQLGGEPADQTAVKQNGDAAAAATEQDGLIEKKPQAGPVMRIVNGEIVLDAASLQVDRHADAARNVGELEDVVETSLTRKINQATYGKRSKTEAWDEEMTDLFYRGLRMFGTDFMMISKLFPGRSRHQIKLKFNNEERRDPERIKQTLLGPSEAIDIATYSEMTNTVYDDPKVIQQELDEERKRIEDQHAKEREAQEEQLRNPDAGKDADMVNGAAVKGKSRNNKRLAVKSMGGGTEEVLGSIDDFPLNR